MDRLRHLALVEPEVVAQSRNVPGAYLTRRMTDLSGMFALDFHQEVIQREPYGRKLS